MYATISNNNTMKTTKENKKVDGKRHKNKHNYSTQVQIQAKTKQSFVLEIEHILKTAKLLSNMHNNT